MGGIIDGRRPTSRLAAMLPVAAFLISPPLPGRAQQVKLLRTGKDIVTTIGPDRSVSIDYDTRPNPIAAPFSYAKLVVKRGFPPDQLMQPDNDAMICEGLARGSDAVTEARKGTFGEGGILPPKHTDPAPYTQAALALDKFAAGRLAAAELLAILQPVLSDCAQGPRL